MRPGRIDRILYIPPPDAEARKAIFQIHIKKMKVVDDLGKLFTILISNVLIF